MTTASTLPRVHIGQVIRNAVTFNPRDSRSKAMDDDADSLIQTVASFFALLEERRAEYVLVGGIALLQYVEGRNTEDIDLIMTLSSLESVPEIEIKTQDNDFVRGEFGALNVDILLTTNPLFDKVRQRHTTLRQFVERKIPCASVEGLILLKLYALPSLYRQGNFARVGLYENDVATLLHYYRPSLDPLFAELALHLSQTDLDQVKEIVAAAQQRSARFDPDNNT